MACLHGLRSFAPVGRRRDVGIARDGHGVDAILGQRQSWWPAVLDGFLQRFSHLLCKREIEEMEKISGGGILWKMEAEREKRE
uniref:Uncharacterized protein n=1 Tax=Nymphaea colorata TaxID=210225 RepID=A0A5K0WH69_9MAGN